MPRRFPTDTFEQKVFSRRSPGPSSPYRSTRFRDAHRLRTARLHEPTSAHHRKRERRGGLHRLARGGQNNAPLRPVCHPSRRRDVARRHHAARRQQPLIRAQQRDLDREAHRHQLGRGRLHFVMLCQWRHFYSRPCSCSHARLVRRSRSPAYDRPVFYAARSSIHAGRLEPPQPCMHVNDHYEGRK